MDLRELKDKATEAFAKGKFAKAAQLYDDYCRADPRDLQARLRMGDAFSKAGNRERAIQAYKSAAEGFAREGFLPRAIAASKLILELDPAHKGVQQMLAELYARRTGPSEGKGARVPGTPVPAAAPPSPSSRPDAIDLPPDDGEPVPLEHTTAAPPAASAPPASDDPGVELELDTPASTPALSSALAAKKVDHSAELPPELQLEIEASTPDAAAAPEPLELEVEVKEVPAAPAPPAAPPGLKPKRTEPTLPPIPQPAPPSPELIEIDVSDEDEEPREVVELTVKKLPTPIPVAPPASGGSPLRPTGRIWVPNAEEPATAEALSAAGAPKRAGQSDLEASLEAFSRFDELELDVPEALAAAPAPAPVAASAAAPVEPKPASAPAPRAISFTELELEGDSLLHAVELAAQAGLAQRGSAAPAASVEESMHGLSDDMAGESVTPAGLPKIPLFSDLPADAFIELFERCPLLRFAEHDRIVEQGSLGDAFYVICAGAVRVVREDGGQRREVATLQEGAFFGEMALLSGAPRSASVESASEETQLLEISAPVLAQLSQRYPQVAQALKKFCRQRFLSNLMSTSALFRPFNKKDRKQIVEKFRARDVKKSDVIIREGSSTDGLYVVLSGEVEVRKADVTLATLREGELFGEMSLLNKTPASATVSATKHTSLLRLPRADFDALVLSHPQILVLISELNEDRRRKTEQALAPVPAEDGGFDLLV